MTPTLTATAEENRRPRRPPRPPRRGGRRCPPTRVGRARLAWNLAADQRPAPSSTPSRSPTSSPSSSYARDHGLRVTTQGTGHFANTLASFDDTILLKTSRMRGLEIDPEARTARAEAGVLWEEVSLAAAEHGLAAPRRLLPRRRRRRLHARRRPRLARPPLRPRRQQRRRRRARHRRRRHVRADRDNEPDLFWAVRGGGGSFGIVTAIEFALYPVAEVYAGILFFPFERGGRDPQRLARVGRRHAATR